MIVDVRWPVVISVCNEPSPPDFPHSGACGNYKRGGRDPQVGCLATDWAPATINIITPQVAGNMRSTVATAYRDLKTKIETRQRPSFTKFLPNWKYHKYLVILPLNVSKT